MAGQTSDVKKYFLSENLKSCLETIAESLKGFEVISCHFSDLGTKGENFTGAITKAKVTFRGGKNDLIYKECIIKEDRITGPVPGKGFFKQEIYMYNNVLPQMSKVIKNLGLNYDEERLWCDFIGYKSDHTLILSDLTSEGYKILDRTKGLDLLSARFTLREIAKFHAISKYILLNGGITESDFTPHYTCFEDPPDVLLSIYKGGLAQLARSVATWEPLWTSVATKIKLQIDNVLHRLKRINDEPYNRRFFQVLNHGDPWTCNLMYKIGHDNQPTSIRLLDYQNCHVHSLAWDLTHFIYSSIFPKERISGYKTLIHDYQTSLAKYMKLLKIDDFIPTCEEIEVEMERFTYYSFVVTAINFSIATCENKNAFSLKDLLEEGKRGFKKDPFHPDVFKGTTRFKESVGMDMLKYAEAGDMDSHIIKGILNKNEWMTSVDCVLDIKVEDALPKGDNFVSSVLRYHLKLLLRSGAIIKKRLIVKTSSGFEIVNKLYSTFINEIKCYDLVLKSMEKLMEDFEDSREKLWCRMFGYNPYDMIALEDLTENGYIVVDRTKCLDLNHSLLVLKSLGRFHAMSKMIEKPDDLLPHFLSIDNEIGRTLRESEMRNLGRIMIEYWPSDMGEIGHRILNLEKTIMKKLEEITEVSEKRFNVLNHGDIWTCNLMFKYIDGRAFSVKFLDFQRCHYNSFMWDFLFFVYSSVVPDLRRRNFELLLKVYLDSLKENLLFYGYRGEIPSFETALEEAERLDFLSFVLIVDTLAITTTDADAPLRLQNAFTDKDDVFNPEIWKNEKFINWVKEDFINWAEKGTI